MSSQVDKAGSHRLTPGARLVTPGGSGMQPGAIPIQPPTNAFSSPISRRPSIPVIGSSASSVASSSTAPRIGIQSSTKSYLSAKPSGAGTPIFVGSGAHTHAQARAASLAPPPSPRRSQTPQLAASSFRGSVPRESTRPTPLTRPTPPTRINVGQDSTSTPTKRAAEIDNVEASPRLRRKIPTRGSKESIIQPPGEDNIISSSTPTKTQSSEAPTSPPNPTSSSSSKGKQRAVSHRPGNPPTAYVLFSREIRPRLAIEAGTIEGASFNITARVREEWQELPEEEKAPFREDAAQRKQVWRSLMDDWEAKYPEEVSAVKNHTRRRASSKSRGRSEPVPPSKDALQYFRDDHIRDGGDEAWSLFSKKERDEYLAKEKEAQEQHLAEKEEWDREGEFISNNKKNNRTISDDEADYLLEVEQYGPSLKTRRVDARSTAMADLSQAAFKQGRASKRTFDMERKLKSQTKERQRQLKEQRRARMNKDYMGEVSEEAAVRESQPANGSGQQRERVEPEEEESVDDGEEEESGEEEEEESDAESLGAASEAMPPLRDNRFTIRTRIVNGQIVLDESSLQQSRSNDAGIDGQDYIDVDEEDRFVNSATYSKRVGTDRWDALETQAFLRAVSMWGSDFEMISRMFVNRDRRQIRAKWRSMEKQDSRSLDLAFQRKLPVDLSEYGSMAGVDLSGEPPKIEARTIKKPEPEEEEVEEEQVQRKEIEYDENGLEIVEEGGDEEARTDSRKKSVTPLGMAKSKSPSIAAAETDIEDDEELPTEEEARRLAASIAAARKERAPSNSSATSHRPRANSMTGTNSAAEVVERQKNKKEQEKQNRMQRENRRRRQPVSTNEEEVLD